MENVTCHAGVCEERDNPLVKHRLTSKNTFEDAIEEDLLRRALEGL